jgi:hypothetical protein
MKKTNISGLGAAALAAAMFAPSPMTIRFQTDEFLSFEPLLRARASRHHRAMVKSLSRPPDPKKKAARKAQKKARAINRGR